MRAADASTIGSTENPDPRGPCGAKIVQPDLTQDAAIGITSSSVLGVQGVMRPTEISAEDYLDANVEDADADCPPWTSTTNTGSTQTVTLLDVVPDQRVDDAIDQQLGIVLKIETEGQTAYAGVVFLRAGDVLSEVAYYGAAEVDARTVEELVVLAAARLATAV